MRSGESRGIGSCEAGIMFAFELESGVGCGGGVVVLGGFRMVSMREFSKDSLYGTVWGENSTLGFWGSGSSVGKLVRFVVGEVEEVGVGGAFGIVVSGSAMLSVVLRYDGIGICYATRIREVLQIYDYAVLLCCGVEVGMYVALEELHD